MLLKLNLELCLVKNLKNYCKYLNLSTYNKKKKDLIETIRETIAARKIQFLFYKKKKYHCPICMEALHSPMQTLNQAHYHTDCLINWINSSGTLTEPILKTPIPVKTLCWIDDQAEFINEKNIFINLTEIEEEKVRNEDENALLQAIYETISEFERHRSMNSIQEIQIFFQYFFTLNSDYTLFILNSLIEIKRDDKDFQKFLIAILHKFEANLNENEEQLKQTKESYKSIYSQLQTQAFIPPILFETSFFENLLLSLNNRMNRRQHIRRIEGGPQTRHRARRAHHVFSIL